LERDIRRKRWREKRQKNEIEEIDTGDGEEEEKQFDS